MKFKNKIYKAFMPVLLALSLFTGCVPNAESSSTETTSAFSHNAEYTLKQPTESFTFPPPSETFTIKEKSTTTKKTEKEKTTAAKTTKKTTTVTTTTTVVTSTNKLKTTTTHISEPTSASLEKLEVHFIDVGQGDAILISCGGHYMMIDAGDNSKGSTVRYYIKKLGVTTLDYMIGTHPDADHIGGMDVIIENFDVKTILMPDATNDTATYRDVIDAIKWTSNKITYPEVGKKYTLGDAAFTILSPNRKYDDLNNMSIAVLLEHGNKKFVFTGDCGIDSEADIIRNGINIKADVLKLGHHGSKTSSSQAFLDAVSPTDVVISCGKDNSYGHPHKSVIDRVKKMNTNCYRTDEQGTLIATSDGNSISWNVKPSTTWNYGVYTEQTSDGGTGGITSTAKSTTTTAAEKPVENTEYTYILNTNSLKFHFPDCKSVAKMAEHNKEYSNKTREELISEGYSPCKNCNP